MAERLKGKIAVVTGAGRGIGRAEALALASEGAKVVVNDLGVERNGQGGSGSPAADVVLEIIQMGGEATANYASVTTREGGESIIKTAVDVYGGLDILVNNAGILRDRMIYNMTDEEWDIVQKVHLYGPFYTTRAACNIFRGQNKGRIINTSSVAGLGQTFGQVNYGAAKEGIVGLTRQVAKDMARYGVTCNAIRPTAGTRMTLDEGTVQSWKKAGMEDMIRMHEDSKPEDIAALVVFLASDEAAYITGRTFYVQTGVVGLYAEPVLEKSLCKVGGLTIDEIFEFLPKTVVSDLRNLYLASSSK